MPSSLLDIPAFLKTSTMAGPTWASCRITGETNSRYRLRLNEKAKVAGRLRAQGQIVLVHKDCVRIDDRKGAFI